MVPEYEIAGQRLRRKNWYMPCVIAADFDGLPDDEQARVLKATYWADNITNREWPVVLGHDDATTTNRYRLKRKAAGWMMALARISVINPELFEAAAAQAREMYADQVGEQYPWGGIATGLAGIPRGPDGGSTELTTYTARR